jgi:hypothetical protein
LHHWVSVASLADKVEPSTLKERILKLLIFSKWLTGEASRLGVSVSRAEAERELQTLRIDQAEGLTYQRFPNETELRTLLVASKVGPDDRRWLMTMSLLLPKVEQARLAEARRKVPRGEVEKYYRSHSREFFLPDQRDLEIIGSLQTSVIWQAKREIEAGKPFLEVAKRVSTDGEAPEGLWHLVRGQDEPPVEKVVFAAKPHVLVGPAKYSLEYIFEVLDSIPAHEEPIAQAETAIREKLAPSVNSLRAGFEAQWIARTSCRAAYVVPRCAEYAARTASAHA